MGSRSVRDVDDQGYESGRWVLVQCAPATYCSCVLLAVLLSDDATRLEASISVRV